MTGIAAKRSSRRSRRFGRQYVIRWNDVAHGHDVMLGHEHIGFHAQHDGAAALVAWHARQGALPLISTPSVMTVAADGAISVDPVDISCDSPAGSRAAPI
ncbi:MAG TPA: hypothetical protein VNU97_07885 [Rhizomicrobium sp.]|jgi:hypothetical protein|nr:hypothetical protein [Rhizomicrobium sp.]